MLHLRGSSSHNLHIQRLHNYWRIQRCWAVRSCHGTFHHGGNDSSGLVHQSFIGGLIKALTSFFPSILDFTGSTVLRLNGEVKAWLSYLKEFLAALFSGPLRFKETIFQVYEIGYKSTPIILLSVSFAAGVTIIEYSYHIKLVIGTAALVPGFAALLVLRELGAVITALLLTSRVGAGIAAEVGTMKVTEQIDALKLLNIDPMKYLVVPRFLATVISSMIIVLFANATCLFFAMLVSMQKLGFSWESFVHAMNHFAQFKDLLLAMVKAGVFGSVIPVVSCFYGFNCKAGAEGVGHATTQSVVTNAILIIGLDFVLTYLFSYLY